MSGLASYVWFFFFKQKSAYDVRISDWSSDVCSSDLKFIGKGLDFAILPGENPDDWAAVLGVANVENLSSWCLAKAAEALPEGTYRVEDIQPGSAMLGWLTAQYRFDRYRDLNGSAGPRILLVEDVKDRKSTRLNSSH